MMKAKHSAVRELSFSLVGFPVRWCIFGNSQVKDPGVSFHRFPRDPVVKEFVAKRLSRCRRVT